MQVEEGVLNCYLLQQYYFHHSALRYVTDNTLQLNVIEKKSQE